MADMNVNSNSEKDAGINKEAEINNDDLNTDTTLNDEALNKDEKNNGKALPLIIALMLGIVVGAGGVSLKYKESISFAKKNPLFFETQKFMRDEVEMKEPKLTEEQAIQAYLSLYGDEYMTYERVDIKSKEYNLDRVNYSSVASGCGFKVDFNDNGELYFSKIVADKAADTAGVKVNDKILSIDGTDVSEYTDALLLFKNKDKMMKLVLESDGVKETIELERVNDENMVPEISSEMIGNTLYIPYRILSYNSDAKFISYLEKNTFDSLIIDLRDNLGGDISIAVSAADKLIGEAEVTLHGYDNSIFTYSTDENVDVKVPIVLLVNENTASSSEIFTALIKQNTDAVIVGTTTYGKGIYQSNGMFKGGNIHYTDGYFTVGDWECWQGKGISPDVDVEMDNTLIGTDDDVQLEKAIELLS